LKAGDALVTQQADNERLAAENARLRKAMGLICEKSNYDDVAVRMDLSSAIDDVHGIAVNAYYHKGDTHE
jgi:hypothetical protein